MKRVRITESQSKDLIEWAGQGFSAQEISDKLAEKYQLKESHSREALRLHLKSRGLSFHGKSGKRSKSIVKPIVKANPQAWDAIQEALLKSLQQAKLVEILQEDVNRLKNIIAGKENEIRRITEDYEARIKSLEDKLQSRRKTELAIQQGELPSELMEVVGLPGRASLSSGLGFHSLHNIYCPTTISLDTKTPFQHNVTIKYPLLSDGFMLSTTKVILSIQMKSDNIPYQRHKPKEAICNH